MTSISTSVSADVQPTTAASGERARRRAHIATAVIGLFSLGLLIDLLVAGHTSGEELWGPVTAASSALVAALSLVYLAVRARNRATRIALYALWATVAFFGYGGYNDHRLPVPAGVVDSRPRPPLAPLVFTGMGVMGAVNLRSGAKGS